jgi:uncharacterized protein (DUF1501 family)
MDELPPARPQQSPATPEPWNGPGVPLPADDDVGDPGAKAAHLKRRTFLALGGGAAALGALGATLGPTAWDRLFGQGTHAGVPVTATGRRSATGRTLVLITLYGGNDGLNTVVPYQDPAYAAARGPIGLDPSMVVPLAGGFGLHPAMPQFKSLWDAQKLAIVHGVGFADPNFSHFESMDIWQSGMLEPVSTGWLGRWLDATKASPLTAIGIGPTLPTALVGTKVQGCAIPAGAIKLPGDATSQALFARMAHADAHEPGLQGGTASSNADLLLVQRKLGAIVASTASSDPLHLAGASPNTLSGQNAGALAIANGGGGRSTASVLASQLSIVANLILAGASTEIYNVNLGGFDTHAAQAGTQEALLGELDAAVGAFVDAVGADPSGRGRDTVVVVYTEFGRRVLGNASSGTDHGWANVVFVTGPMVKGGFYGEPPSLASLNNGNIVYTTDFRSVYATVFEHVLGVGAAPFLQGSFPSIALL